MLSWGRTNYLIWGYAAANVFSYSAFDIFANGAPLFMSFFFDAETLLALDLFETTDGTFRTDPYDENLGNGRSSF